MERLIKASEIRGTLCAPSSKSAMIRAVALSLLAHGKTFIKNPTYCTDALAALNIVCALGGEIMERSADYILIAGNPDFSKGSLNNLILNCGESGLCIRMFSPIAGLSDERIILEGEGTLKLRPVNMIEDITKLGAYCITNNGFPPVEIKGPISPGKYRINGSKSSQFLTGLMIALPLCDGDSEIYVDDLKSKPYLKMTLEMMQRFGVHCDFNDRLNRFFIQGNQRYKATEYAVEGDWSGAAFMLVAGAISGSITVTGLNINSNQADRVIVDVLKMAGASINVEADRVTVTQGELEAIEFNAEDCPDIVPPVVALAAHCKGKTILGGIERLRIKESNRLDALIKEFSKMGINIYIEKERLVIEGGKVKSAVIEPHGDHRIAMACAVCGLAGEGQIIIKNPECVAKSYPLFFQNLEKCMEER
ncbi:MAG TPA: 3-phosphoshikimate 1-carboxyvinyltransferase [Syntrophorhabdaceae bacterium]|nr:3-phosphoshikimate 1-carboxyvinyltransferase [Syntrophorhabdaceae bacterium]HPU30362.1 3-phosphoshikimate 1-carboxyvinyltransferase [Syntrophorhabdaceae bacterium]